MRISNFQMVHQCHSNDQSNSYRKSSLLCLSILLICVEHYILPCSGYCWQAGWNPGFTGPPTVSQVSIDRVRISWSDIVKHRECADQFLVKYWPRSSPMQYSTSDLVPPDVNHIDIYVTPKIMYQFQAVAREDKGVIGGIDWNKSPVIEFKTSTFNTNIVTLEDLENEEKSGRNSKRDGLKNHINSDSRAIIRTASSGDVASDGPKGSMTSYYHKRNSPGLEVLGISIELFVALIIASLVALLVIVGVIYQLTCGKRWNAEVHTKHRKKTTRHVVASPSHGSIDGEDDDCNGSEVDDMLSESSPLPVIIKCKGEAEDTEHLKQNP